MTKWTRKNADGSLSHISVERLGPDKFHTQVARECDVKSVLEANRELRNASLSGPLWKGNMTRVARVPLTLLELWSKALGIDENGTRPYAIADPEYRKEFNRLLNDPDLRGFRTDKDGVKL